MTASALELALLAESVEQTADHATEKSDDDKPKRKVERLLELRSCCGLAAMRALNGHAVQTPNDPSSATRRTGRHDGHRDAPAGLDAMMG